MLKILLCAAMNPALIALLAGAAFIALSPIFVREALAAGSGRPPPHSGE
jgi:hypothetical protein